MARGLAAGAPLSTLIRIFILNHAVPESEAAAALAPLSLDRAQDLGILRPAEAGVAGTIRITPYREFVL